MVKAYLTKRQIEIFELYRDGLTQEQIAEKVYGSKDSQGAVSIILQRVGRKIGMKNVIKYRKQAERLYEYEVPD